MRYFTVDAFTDSLFGGNPAGVVLLEENASFPEKSLMIKIAGELRYSETAFVQQNGPAEFSVRYFTPVDEVDLCGHATIASFCVLRDEGIVPKGTVCMNHTLTGDLEVIVGDEVMMQMATPQVLERVVDEVQLWEIMQGGKNSLSGRKYPLQEKMYSLSPQIVSTGLPDIIMPVGSIVELDSLKPDMAALTTLSSQLQVVGVHAFALSEDGYTAHVRNFAPLFGIEEEAATGTANAALTYYLYHNGIIPAGSRCSFMQGEVMRRPSVVLTQIRTNGTVYVGGNSCVLIKGEMNI